MPQPPPHFFIFGCERSGTTLLAALLSEQQDVFVLNDSFIYKVLNDIRTPTVERVLRKGISRAIPHHRLIAHSEASKLPDAEERIGPAETATFLSRLERRYRGKDGTGWLAVYADRLDPDPILGAAAQGTLTARLLLSHVYLQLTPPEQREKRWLGEKTPAHIYLAPMIRSRYPDAPLITLVRRPVTNVAAIHRRINAHSIDVAINIWKSCFDRRLAGLYDGRNALVLRYEELVHETETALARVFRYLGVDVDGIATSFAYYIKNHYIGNQIDPERDRALEQSLNAEQRRHVMDRCSQVYERVLEQAGAPS